VRHDAVGVTQQVDIDLIDPSPYQPRTRFREETLEELARSIQSNGIIQPVVVRPLGKRFQLIAGERRWRAAQRAGLTKLPAIVRHVPDELALELTLIENIQREDLNPVEEARAFDRLMKEFDLTQEQVAERTGKDRTTVTNALRLLQLDPTLQDMIEEGRLNAGQGRALLAIPDSSLRNQLGRTAARAGFTVRQIERLAKKRYKEIAEAAETGLMAAAEEGGDANFRAALEALEKHLGTKVRFRPVTRFGPGQLGLEFYDEAHLYGLYDRLMKA
jgi:ParB family chromosome partitioning protein